MLYSDEEAILGIFWFLFHHHSTCLSFMPHQARVSGRLALAYDVFIAQILIQLPVLVFYYHHMIFYGLFCLIEEAPLFVKVWLLREFTWRIIVALRVSPPINLEAKSLSNILCIYWWRMVTVWRVLDHLGLFSISFSCVICVGLISPHQDFRFFGFNNR